MYIDEDLKWSEHIKYVYNDIKKYHETFYKVRNKLPITCLKNLYYATVYPHIQYSIELYSNTNKTYLHDLVILNNKMLRILQFMPNTCHISDLFERFNTLQIEDLHKFKLLILIHKYFYGRELLPIAFQKYLNTNVLIHEHNTRTQINIHLDSFASSSGTRCTQFHGSKLWNSLSNEMKNITSNESLKREFKKILQSNCRIVLYINYRNNK